MDGLERMAHGRNQLCQHILSSQPQTGCVDTGVTANKFSPQHIFVNKQLDPVVLIVHQTENAQRAGRNVQKLLHIFAGGEREPGGADLLREFFGLKGLVQIQIKINR